MVPRVGLRQFVVTVPHALRARLAYDGRLLGAVSRIVVDSVLGWYRRRMEIEGAYHGQSGAVTVVRRVPADLELNPHMHLVALDGVFVAGPAGKPVFHALPRISDTAVADLLQIIRARLLRYLIRRHVVEDDGEGQTRFLADDLQEREPALAQLAAVAVAGLPPAGPELRRKPLTIVLPASDGPKVVRPLCVEMDPLSLVSRLAAAVHPPKFHTLRNAGILAAAAKWRSLVVPPPTPEMAALSPTEDLSHSLPMAKDTKARPATHRCGYVPWQRLMRQLGIDVETRRPLVGAR